MFQIFWTITILRKQCVGGSVKNKGFDQLEQNTSMMFRTQTLSRQKCVGVGGMGKRPTIANNVCNFSNFNFFKLNLVGAKKAKKLKYFFPIAFLNYCMT